MNTDNLLGLFIDESKENLQFLNNKLLELEKKPEDFSLLNEIFRIAHTFKGMSKTMGFNRMGDLTHNLENLLELLRSGQITIDEKIITCLFKGFDKLEILMATIIETGNETECPGIKEFIKELKEIAPFNDPENEPEIQTDINTSLASYELLAIEEAIAQGYSPKEISVYIENECVMPGVRCYMVNSLLENQGEIFKTIPTVEEIESNKFLTCPQTKHLVKFFIITKTESDIIMQKILSVSEIEKVEILDIKDSKKSYDIQEKESEKNKQSSKITSHTVRVNAERLDNLVNLVGELIINKTRLSQLTQEINNPELNGVSAYIESITGEIQDIVMNLRMVPIEQVFSRFPRLVRDISKEMDKDVNLIIQGQEIEIDRSLIDEIAEPLVHIIRNALDHGLETREERIKAGKKVKGTLQLIAHSEYNKILIKIIDDGKGIDTEKIYQKALEKGLILPKDRESRTESEIMEYLFLPGFSTAEKTTDLSGRGVGMDVVKTKITALNGTVNIKSEKGIGTTVTITLPSTLAITQALLVEVGEETYALPLNYINEVIEIPINQVKHIQNKEVINFRGCVIPIKRLDELLNVPECSIFNTDKLTLVLIQSEENLVAVSVSKIINQQEIVIKTLNKNLSSKNYVSGVTTLGNGQIALILNVNTLIR
ncbi:MAG: hypothetical protein A2Y25_11660 [Candidatus Melainabacteria bacterium GWF2_37_15]|nr:MAG: hypothetical protein A2Y25_11660 [Candidatus Melainabacteria bacterium GWF2_37_15]